jgi:hypothetical protein
MVPSSLSLNRMGTTGVDSVLAIDGVVESPIVLLSASAELFGLCQILTTPSWHDVIRESQTKTMSERGSACT